jgi:gas vesicle protein
MDTRFYFWVGLILGLVVGIAAALLYQKIRGLVANPELRRLRQENRSLRERMEKKDKHIQEMMHHTEKIATGLAELSDRRKANGS